MTMVWKRVDQGEVPPKARLWKERIFNLLRCEIVEVARLGRMK